MEASLKDNDPLRLAFDTLDKDKDGKIDCIDLLNSYSKLADSIIEQQDELALNNFILSKVGCNTLNFDQFCQLLDTYGVQIIPESLNEKYSFLDSNIAGLLRDLALNDAIKTKPIKEPKKENKLISDVNLNTLKHLVAGGIAGGVSRTVVSPFERMKILFQVQGNNTMGYNSVWGTLSKIWREEGFVGFMRGNGTNVIRIVPYSAVQFASYEKFKLLLLAPGASELDTTRRLTAGALAGITSVIFTYPLDVVRTRLSIQSINIPVTKTSNTTPKPVSASNVISPVRTHTTKTTNPQKLPGIWGTLTSMYMKEGGVRALYQGLGPTLMGVAPYVALNFQSYEVLRAYFTPPGETSPSGVSKLICGALAGTIAQTFTYPLDVLRRRMQVNGLSDMLGYKYRNTWHAVTEIVKSEGIKGLYKGMIPNYLKVAPAIGVSFYTYEICKNVMNC
ncbi:mitochondrial carrier [Neoconidiobolus thromboides FSU 785]|nr:mitochondrial carrier [Neoconidiobolus thromboides FSU 785]